MKKKECFHVYMLYDNTNITEAHLYELARSTGINNIPPLYKIIDRRKCYAEFYKYCPHCGEKLNWNKFKRMANGEWDYSVGGDD